MRPQSKVGLPFPRRCEKINNLTQRRQDTKTGEEQRLCFLCALCDFAPLREMLLLVQEFFHTFLPVGIANFDLSGRGLGHATQTAPTQRAMMLPEANRQAQGWRPAKLCGWRRVLRIGIEASVVNRSVALCAIRPVSPLTGKTTDGRAGRGRSAWPVRREGDSNSIDSPYPVMHNGNAGLNCNRTPTGSRYNLISGRGQPLEGERESRR